MHNKLVRRSLVALVLIFADALSILTSFVLAFHARAWLLVDVVPLFPRMEHGIGMYLAAWALIFLWLVIFAYEDLYPSIGKGFWDEMKALLKGNGLAFTIIVLLTFVTKTSILFSRPVILFAFLASLVILPFMRHTARDVLMRGGFWQKEVVVVGFPAAVRQVLCTLKKHPDLGLRPVGVVLPEGGEAEGLPVYPGIENLDMLPVKAEEVILAMPHVAPDELVRVVEKAMKVAPVVKMVPDLFGIVSTGVKTHDLDGMLLLELEDRLSQRRNVFVKRAFDVALSLLGLVLLLPVFLVLALLIRIGSPGPVFFGHQRLGKDGQFFTCHKFRTMRTDAQAALLKLLEENPALNDEWEKDFKLKDDPRITGIGSILRKTSLDELPQLWNVLRGDMSIVGPRPIVVDEKARYGEKVRYLFRVPPGITGLWQVSGRNDIGYEERVLLDEYYAKNWSIWLDLEIIIRTFGVILKRDGAY